MPHISFDRATPPRTWYRAIWEWVRVKLLRKAPRYARVLSVKRGVMTVSHLPSGMVTNDPVFGEPIREYHSAGRIIPLFPARSQVPVAQQQRHFDPESRR